MFSAEVKSVAELREVATKFIEMFENERHFAFYGSMGAGKTTFIKVLCEVMGTLDNVTSPTFALVNEYDTDKYGNILHFDFYRLNNVEDALNIGFEDYMESGYYCFMEWPERVESILPEPFVEVRIEIVNENTRIIKAQII